MVVVPRGEGSPLFKSAEERLLKSAGGDEMDPDVKCAKVKKIKRKRFQFSSDEETSHEEKSESRKKRKKYENIRICKELRQEE